MSPAAKSDCTLRILQIADTSHSFAQQIIPHLSGTFPFITALLTGTVIYEYKNSTYCRYYFSIQHQRYFINHLKKLPNSGEELL